MADSNSPLITGKDQLVAFHASGARSPQDWRIGTEHEKFGFRLDDLRRFFCLLWLFCRLGHRRHTAYYHEHDA